MGLISAAVSSVSGVLSDSWKEVIEPDDMSDSTLLVKGVAVKKGSNKKGTDNYVSNGSVIHVYPNTLMLLMDGGKIVDYSAQEGYYEVNNSSAPSIFNGELKDSVKETGNAAVVKVVDSQAELYEMKNNKTASLAALVSEGQITQKQADSYNDYYAKHGGESRSVAN